MSEYFDEFLYYVALAVLIALFVKGFLPFFKAATAYIPIAGLQEAAAA